MKHRSGVAFLDLAIQSFQPKMSKNLLASGRHVSHLVFGYLKVEKSFLSTINDMNDRCIRPNFPSMSDFA